MKPALRFVSFWQEWLHHKQVFLKAWTRAPRTMGAITPSGRPLAECLAAQVNPHTGGWVVEVGAGTGPVTQALLKRGVRPEKLLILEREKRLAALLHRKFPHAHVVQAAARRLKKTLKQLNINDIAVIVSSLPLLSIPPNVKFIILKQMTDSIGENGKLVQFSYGLGSPVPDFFLKRERLQCRRVRRIWRNMPPATVWCYGKSVR